MRKIALILFMIGLFAATNAVASSLSAPSKALGIFIYNPMADSDFCNFSKACKNNPSDRISYSQTYPLQSTAAYTTFLYIDSLAFDSSDGKTLALNNIFGPHTISLLAGSYKHYWPNSKIILMVDITSALAGKAIKANPTAAAQTLVSQINNEGWANIDGIMFDVEGPAKLQSTTGQTFFDAVAKTMPLTKYLLISNQNPSNPADPNGAWTFWDAMNRDKSGVTCPAGASCQQGFWVIQDYDLGPDDLKNFDNNGLDADGYPAGFAQFTFNQLLSQHIHNQNGKIQIALPISASADNAASYEDFPNASPKSGSFSTKTLSAIWGETNYSTESCDSSPTCNEYTQTLETGNTVTQCQYSCSALSILNSMVFNSKEPTPSTAQVCGGVTVNYGKPMITVYPVPSKDNIIGIALYQLTNPKFDFDKCVDPLDPKVTKCPTPIPTPFSLDLSAYKLAKTWMANFAAGQSNTPFTCDN